MAAIRSALAEREDPARAIEQRAYMKSTMPFRGVPVPLVRQLARAAARDAPLPDAEAWLAAVTALWDDAAYREERYAALALARMPATRPYATSLDALALYASWIREGAWWDLVDETSHCVGEVLRAHRPEATPILIDWATDADPWIRRSAIICQLQHAQDTDRSLLTHAIVANQDDAGFFLRKAIGWALRDYARTSPDWVRAFVEEHPNLSALSRREATKHL